MPQDTVPVDQPTVEQAEPQTVAQQVEPQPPVVRALPTLRIVINIDRLELSDIMLIDDVSQGREYSIVDAIRLLDRVVEGGVQGRPLNQFRALFGRLQYIVQELANPKSEG